MSTWRMTIVVEVDDEGLAEHAGDITPPPNNVLDWEPRDVFAAVDKGIIDPVTVTFDEPPWLVTAEAVE